MSDYYTQKAEAEEEFARIAADAAALESHEELLQYMRAALGEGGVTTPHFHKKLRCILTNCEVVLTVEDLEMVLGYWRDHAGPVWFMSEDDGFMGIYSGETAGDGEYVAEVLSVLDLSEKERQTWAPLPWVYRCHGYDGDLDDLRIQVFND